MDKFKIETPHAAVVIWNYKERLNSDLSSESSINETETIIINSMSCVSIETSKSKSQPHGNFRLVLAPFRNWVSTITAGSWCCLFMSNEKIEKKDITSSTSTKKKNILKMIGRIESVRIDTQMGEDGTRRTLYYVTGVDWANIFNEILYVDPTVSAAKDQGTQGNILFAALRKLFFTEEKKGEVEELRLSPDEIIRRFISVFGSEVSFNSASSGAGRLGKPVYDFKMPSDLAKYLGLPDATITKSLKLKTGALQSYDTYSPITEALSLPNPSHFQGQHSLWQILIDNSNPPLNEMFCELDWGTISDSPNLTIYKRIKPFSFKGGSVSGSSSKLASYFQNVKQHKIDGVMVTSANVGTNWRDKYNYVEVRFDSIKNEMLENLTKKQTQYWDPVAFTREGFRPLIETTRQLPITPTNQVDYSNIKLEPENVQYWIPLIRDWYFDTHRMLNGTINMVGTTEYIAVGNNIKFDLQIINPTTNINFKTLRAKTQYYILGHIENVSHRFTVNPDSGARTYTTSIQFSRGIIVDSDNVKVGEGTLDSDASKIKLPEDENTKNVIWHSDKQDPDK